jgi:hypothetical protein
MEDLYSPEFWAIVASKVREGQRKGQAVFNTAAEFHHKEAGELTGTVFDPFYQDAKVSAFLEKLADILTR